MEKNQHNSGEEKTQQSSTNLPQQAPGQQVPSDAVSKPMNDAGQQKQERHSESSLPQRDGKTLGTP